MCFNYILPSDGWAWRAKQSPPRYAEKKELYKNAPINYNKVDQAYCKRKVSVYDKPNEQSGAYKEQL